MNVHVIVVMSVCVQSSLEGLEKLFVFPSVVLEQLPVLDPIML